MFKPVFNSYRKGRSMTKQALAKTGSNRETEEFFFMFLNQTLGESMQTFLSNIQDFLTISIDL